MSLLLSQNSETSQGKQQNMEFCRKFSSQRKNIPSADHAKNQASTFYAGFYMNKGVKGYNVNSKISKARAAAHQECSGDQDNNAYFFIRRPRVKTGSSNRSVIENTSGNNSKNMSIFEAYNSKAPSKGSKVVSSNNQLINEKMAPNSPEMKPTNGMSNFLIFDYNQF